MKCKFDRSVNWVENSRDRSFSRVIAWTVAHWTPRHSRTGCCSAAQRRSASGGTNVRCGSGRPPSSTSSNGQLHWSLPEPHRVYVAAAAAATSGAPRSNRSFRVGYYCYCRRFPQWAKSGSNTVFFNCLKLDADFQHRLNLKRDCNTAQPTHYKYC